MKPRPPLKYKVIGWFIGSVITITITFLLLTGMFGAPEWFSAGIAFLLINDGGARVAAM